MSRRRRRFLWGAAVQAQVSLLWSATATWPGGIVPGVAGAVGVDATLPAGQNVVMDIAIDMGCLTIPAGATLTHAATDLIQRFACVTNAGTWQIGTAAVPFTNNLIVELTGPTFGTTSTISYTDGVTTQATFFSGSHPVVNNNDNGGMNRGVMNTGTLDWHGVSKTASIRPSNGVSMAAGTTSFALEATPTGWASGDDIVIGSNVFYDNGNTEKFTLTSPLSGATVTLPSGLVKKRYNNIQYLVDAAGGSISTTPGTVTLKSAGGIKAVAATPTSFDQRPMIVNLTRNIVIRGKNDASWTVDGFGVHVMNMYPGVMRVDGAQFVRAGQNGRLGRYPIHWHMWSYVPTTGAWRGAATGQYVQNCSFDSPSFRMITLHGTNGVTVDNNVGYNVGGGAIFMEDGSEEDNFITNNVVLEIVQPVTVIKAFDVKNGVSTGPTGVWLTNAKNTVTGNYVSRAAGIGIWNSFAQIQCVGLSALATDAVGTRIRPRYRGTTLWSGNTSISNNTLGFATRFAQIDNDGTIGTVGGMWQPMSDGTTPTSAALYRQGDEASTPDWAYGTGTVILGSLLGMTAFKNSVGGYNNLVQIPLYSGGVMADNLQAGFAGVVQVNPTSVVQNFLMVGTSLNADLTNDPIPSRFGISLKNRWAQASYHTSLNFNDMTYVAYPYMPFDSTAQYFPTNGKRDGGGIMAAGDLYLVPMETGFYRSSNWSIASDSSMGYHMPPNLLDTWTLAGAKLDYNGLWGAGAGKYIIFDTPFLTTAAAGLAALGPTSANTYNVSPSYQGGGTTGAIGWATTTKYYGLQPFISDVNISGPMINRYCTAINVERVDSSLTHIDNWNVKDGRANIAYAASGTTPIAVGDTVTNTANGLTLVVSAITVTAGSWAAGTAVGSIYANDTAISGTWANTNPLQVGGVTRATATSAMTNPTLSIMRHFAAQQGAYFMLTLPNDVLPTNRFVVKVSGQLLADTDYFMVSLPWNGTGAHVYVSYGDVGSGSAAIPGASAWRRHVNTSVASIAAVLADTTAQSYYYDTGNGRVWLRVSNAGMTFASSPYGARPANDSETLERNMVLTLVPTATTGGF